MLINNHTLFFSMLFLILGTVILNAQKTPGTLVFKDGSIKKGFVQLASSERVKFKVNKKDKAIKYEFTDLEYAEISINDEVSRYKLVSILDKDLPIVLKEIVSGKVSLFNLNTQGYSPGVPMGGGMAGAPMYPMGTNYSIKNLYVLKQGEAKATHLGSNQLFSKNFKQAASDYFKDCENLVAKIQNRDFKKKEIKAIVEYYNSQCE